VGEWYQAFVTPDEDAKIQAVGKELMEKGLLWDSRRKRPVQLRDGGRVPTYAIAKYALQKLFNGHPKSRRAAMNGVNHE
jgi:hypothetical protein